MTITAMNENNYIKNRIDNNNIDYYNSENIISKNFVDCVETADTDFPHSCISSGTSARSCAAPPRK